VTTATKVAIKPLEDRIVVQANEAETTTASGIVIPDTAKEKPQEGTVLAVGPGRIDDKGNRVPVDVKEGDVVIYSKYGGTEVKYAGEDYLILSARDVLAIVEKLRVRNHSPRSRPRVDSGAVPSLNEKDRGCPRFSASPTTPGKAWSAGSTRSPMRSR
jgi:chaperonin GroES